MKKYLLGAAALLAMAAPGMAHADPSGYVGATYNNVHVDGLGSDDAWGAEGAVAFQGSDTIGFELDGAILDSDNSDTSEGLTGHVFTRNDNYLFGGFAGVAHSDDSTTWDTGLEANKFFQRWTLAGAVAYANNNDTDTEGYGVNAQARFFPTDNLRLQAGVGWASVNAPGGDGRAVSEGVGAEYQLSAVPISFGAGYQHVAFDHSGPEGNVWTLGIRYNFGAGTLRDRDRSGASQADISGVSSAIGF